MEVDPHPWLEPVPQGLQAGPAGWVGEGDHAPTAGMGVLDRLKAAAAPKLPMGLP